MSMHRSGLPSFPCMPCREFQKAKLKKLLTPRLLPPNPQFGARRKGWAQFPRSAPLPLPACTGSSPGGLRENPQGASSSPTKKWTPPASGELLSYGVQQPIALPSPTPSPPPQAQLQGSGEVGAPTPPWQQEPLRGLQHQEGGGAAPESPEGERLRGRGNRKWALRRGRGGGEEARAKCFPPQQHRRPSGGFTCSAGRFPSSYALTRPPLPPPHFIFCLCPLCVSLSSCLFPSVSQSLQAGRAGAGARALGAPPGREGEGRGGSGGADQRARDHHVTAAAPLPRRAPPLITPRGSRASRALLRRRPPRIWRLRGRAL